MKNKDVDQTVCTVVVFRHTDAILFFDNHGTLISCLCIVFALTDPLRNGGTCAPMACGDWKVVFIIVLLVATVLECLIMVSDSIILLVSVEAFDTTNKCLQAPDFESRQNSLIVPEIFAQTLIFITELVVFPAIFGEIKKDPPKARLALASVIIALCIAFVASFVLAIRNSEHSLVWLEPTWSTIGLWEVGASPFIINYGPQIALGNPRRIFLTKLGCTILMVLTILLWTRFKLQGRALCFRLVSRLSRSNDLS